MTFVFLGMDYLTQYDLLYFHLPAKFMILFYFIAQYYSTVYMFHKFLDNSLSERHLGDFHFLAIVNIATMNMTAQMSVQ